MSKKIILAVMAIVVILLVSASGFAHTYQRATSDNPLRYIAYVVYPVGIAGEYLVMRPIHWFVSRPNVSKICGHKPTPEDIYFEW